MKGKEPKKTSEGESESARKRWGSRTGENGPAGVDKNQGWQFGKSSSLLVGEV